MHNLNVVVYYHYPCHDGYLAQLIVKRCLSKAANVTTVPLQHGAKHAWDFSAILPNTTVMFVDIAPTSEMLAELELHPNVEMVSVWDHHIDFRNAYPEPWKTTALPNWFGVVISHLRYSSKTTFWWCNDISGCRLAAIGCGHWLTENANRLPSLDIEQESEFAALMYNHPIVQHASDYDTWTKALPNTDAVFAYYRNYKYEDVAKWDALIDRITEFDTPGYNHIVQQGKAMNEAMFTLAEKLATGNSPIEKTITIQSETYKGVIVNAYGLLANDVGEIFRTQLGYDFAVMYSINPTHISLSIRSRPGVPSNEIAQIWGGGGHAGSAGAGIVGEDRIPWLLEWAML